MSLQLPHLVLMSVLCDIPGSTNLLPERAHARARASMFIIVKIACTKTKTVFACRIRKVMM